MLSHTRRLTPEEIQANLPKILGAHMRKETRIEERRSVENHQKQAANLKVGPSLGDSLRRAYSKGLRVRGPSGRFLGLPKA